MKGSLFRLSTLAYFAMMSGFLVVGCTTKEDPAEVLTMCGNHSCGNLIMVTTDTSSDGFQYLDPALSPDGNTIVFTADWQALPSTDRPPDPLPLNRQLVLVPVREGTHPETNLEASGATLIFFGFLGFDDLNLVQKGDPVWFDDTTIIFWMQTGLGNRLFAADITSTPVIPTQITVDVTDGQPDPWYWQHVEPALSQDRKWVAYTRFGTKEELEEIFFTNSSILVGSVETGEIFTVIEDASTCGGATWSPDGRHIAFHASLDLIGEDGVPGTELFSVVFDTTGLAANGAVTLNNQLRRLTFTEASDGDPLTTVKNLDPTYTADGNEIIFVSTRRAPSITLHDRNLWKIPSDGRLAPEIYFFSREDDLDPDVRVGPSREIVFSSAMGFPTEMLDRIEQETYEENLPVVGETQARAIALEEREDLEFFARVMSHIFVFSP